MKFRYCWLLAAVLVWTGCGKEERREATSLCKVLSQKQADLAATNGLEKDLVASTRAWYEGIINNGAGAGKGLEDNAASAKTLSQSAALVSTQLGQVRQAIYDQPLKQEYPQGVRDTVINQLMKRQRTLQEVRAALDACAANFVEFEHSRAYKGDTYPAGIDKLNSLLSGYTGPEDAVGKATQDLKSKYTLTDADLLSKT
jgi:hypothetical protein